MTTGRIIEIVVLIVLIAVTAYFWNKSKKQAQAQAQTENEEIRIIQTVKIEGMMCQKCASKVTEALSKFGSVEVNLEEKTATITSSELADAVDIEEVVTQLGFKFEGMVE